MCPIQISQTKTLRILIFVSMVFLIMTGGCKGLLEKTLVCFPEKAHNGRPEDFGLQARDLYFETQERVKLHGWLFVRDPRAPFLLWCHGNAGNISHRLDNIARLLQHGINVFIFDYRGYGKSGGTLSESGFYQDAEAAWETLVREGPVPPARVVLFGRSLGCAMAADLATRVPAAGLILESGFPHLGAIAKIHYPFIFSERLLSGRYDALSRLKRIKMPVLVIHGDRDTIVPIHLGRRLFDAAPEPREWCEIKGGDHNDTYLVGGPAYFQKLLETIGRWVAI
jgi:pimeloyl-ACP methyl ester carboxylesterase